MNNSDELNNNPLVTIKNNRTVVDYTLLPVS